MASALNGQAAERSKVQDEQRQYAQEDKRAAEEQSRFNRQMTLSEKTAAHTEAHEDFADQLAQKGFDLNSQLSQIEIKAKQHDLDRMPYQDKVQQAKDDFDAAMRPLEMKHAQGLVKDDELKYAGDKLALSIAQAYGVQEEQLKLAKGRADIGLTQAETGYYRAGGSGGGRGNAASNIGGLTEEGSAFYDMLYTSGGPPPTPPQALSAIMNPGNRLTQSDRKILAAMVTSGKSGLPTIIQSGKLDAAATDLGKFGLNAQQQQAVQSQIDKIDAASDPVTAARDLLAAAPAGVPQTVKDFITNYATHEAAARTDTGDETPAGPPPARLPGAAGAAQQAAGVKAAAPPAAPLPPVVPAQARFRAQTSGRPANVPADARPAKLKGAQGWASPDGNHFWDAQGRQVA